MGDVAETMVVVVVVVRLVLVAAVVVEFAVLSVVVTAGLEQAANSASTTNVERRIGRSYGRSGLFPNLPHAAPDREMGQCGLGLVDGDGQFDAVGVGVNYVDGVDVYTGIGQPACDLSELSGGVR